MFQYIRPFVYLYLYFLFHFLCCVFLGAIASFRGDHCNFRLVLDPNSLKIASLRQVLNNRGVDYGNAIEKQDLIKLAISSGEVTEQELLEINKVEKIASYHERVNFASGDDFRQKIEKKMESIWLIQVMVRKNENPIVDTKTWKQTVAQVSKFGVKTGIVRCPLYRKFCTDKGWNGLPMLHVILPKSDGFSGDRETYNYFYRSKNYSVLKWLLQCLSVRVVKIPSLTLLESDWLSTSRMPGDLPIKMVFISSILEPPLFISALAIAFNGRVKFGFFHTPNNNEVEPILQAQVDYYKTQNSTYIISTPESVFQYGLNVGETYSYNRLLLYFNNMYPEMNDVFYLTIFILNIMLVLHVFLGYRDIDNWVIKKVLIWFLGNLFFSFLWASLCDTQNYNAYYSFSSAVAKYPRYISKMPFSTTIRNHWSYISSYPVLIVTFIIFVRLTKFVLKKLEYSNDDD